MKCDLKTICLFLTICSIVFAVSKKPTKDSKKAKILAETKTETETEAELGALMDLALSLETKEKYSVGDRNNFEVHINGQRVGEFKGYPDNEAGAGKFGRGIYLRTNSRNGHLAQCTIVDGQDIFFPYNRMGIISWRENGWNDKRTLEFVIKGMDGKYYTVKLHLDFNIWCNDTQADYCAKLNSNQLRNKNTIRTGKKESCANCADWVANKRAYDAAKSGRDEVLKEKTRLDAEVAKLRNLLGGVDTELKANLKKITDQQKEIDDIEAKIRVNIIQKNLLVTSIQRTEGLVKAGEYGLKNQKIYCKKLEHMIKTNGGENERLQKEFISDCPGGTCSAKINGAYIKGRALDIPGTQLQLGQIYS